jgi:hypothetical protein
MQLPTRLPPQPQSYVRFNANLIKRAIALTHSLMSTHRHSLAHAHDARARRTHTHTHTHTHAHTHTHTHTHTHMRTIFARSRVCELLEAFVHFDVQKETYYSCTVQAVHAVDTLETVAAQRRLDDSPLPEPILKKWLGQTIEVCSSHYSSSRCVVLLALIFLSLCRSLLFLSMCSSLVSPLPLDV